MEKDVISEIILRIRVLEQQIRKIDENLKSLENFLNFYNKNFENKIKEQELYFKSLKERIDEINQKIDKLENELKRKADLSELKELKELINLFNPLTSNFVTKEELKRIIESISK